MRCLAHRTWYISRYGRDTGAHRIASHIIALHGTHARMHRMHCIASHALHCTHWWCAMRCDICMTFIAPQALMMMCNVQCMHRRIASHGITFLWKILGGHDMLGAPHVPSASRPGTRIRKTQSYWILHATFEPIHKPVSNESSTRTKQRANQLWNSFSSLKPPLEYLLAYVIGLANRRSVVHLCILHSNLF